MKSYQLAEFGSPLVESHILSPTPSKQEIVLDVLAAGVCHTDLHIQEGGYDLGHGKRLAFKDRGLRLPLTLGHETVGRVVAIGEGVKDVEIGKAYLIYPWIGCGQCETCQQGHENLCAQPASLGVQRDGGYAEKIVVPNARYLIDIGDLAPVTTAPLACSGLTAYSAVRKAGMAIRNNPVVIIGAGGLGLTCIAILKAMGGAGAVVVDIDDSKLAAARKAGAIATVNSRTQNVQKELAALLPAGARTVIDFVASPDTTSLGFDCLGKGGHLILVGLYGGAASWPLPLIAVKAVTISGSLVGNLDELRELIKLMKTGSLQPQAVTCCPMHHLNHTLDDLRHGRLIGRAVLVPEKNDSK